MFDNSCFANEITDFCELRTGHKRLKVVAVNKNGWILFIARILQNRPRTTGKILFDNGKAFHLKSKKIEGQEVSLFLWTEDLQRRWLWQNEIGRIKDWLENYATPEDVMVVQRFVAEESGRSMVWSLPSFHTLAVREIVTCLHELGLVQLQRIAGMLYVEKTAA